VSLLAGSRFLVVGHCTIDEIRLPDGKRLPLTIGGAAAYAAVAAAMLGAQVRLVSLVGDDYPLDGLGRVGGEGSITVDYTLTRPGPSIHATGRYGPDGSRHFEIASWKRLQELTPTVAELEPALSSGAAVLLTPAPAEMQAELAALAQRNDCSVYLDTELHYIAAAPAALTVRALAGTSTAFLPSVDHLALLFDLTSPDPIEYLAALGKLGCRAVVVKQAASGSTAIDFVARTATRIPAVAGVEVVDPTGAGDAFNGGFVAALASGSTLVEAACWGTVAASFMVEGVGARVPSHFSRELAEKRFAALRPEPEQRAAMHWSQIDTTPKGGERHAG
jgi:sugar/nucleoside kinase (ribokinase family)